MFAIGSNNCVISFRNNEEKPDLICNSKGVVNKGLQLSVSNPDAFASVSYHIDEDLTQISASITGDVLTASEIGDVYIYAEGDGQYSDTLKVSIEEKKLVFTNSFADPVVGSSIILSSAFNDGSEATGVEYSITSGGEFASLNGNVLTLNAIGQITIKAQCDGLEVSETINSVPDMNLNISYIGLNNTKDLSVTYNCEVPASSTIGFEIVSGDAATLSGNKFFSNLLLYFFGFIFGYFFVIVIQIQ